MGGDIDLPTVCAPAFIADGEARRAATFIRGAVGFVLEVIVGRAVRDNVTLRASTNPISSSVSVAAS